MLYIVYYGLFLFVRLLWLPGGEGVLLGLRLRVLGLRLLLGLGNKFSPVRISPNWFIFIALAGCAVVSGHRTYNDCNNLTFAFVKMTRSLLWLYICVFSGCVLNLQRVYNEEPVFSSAITVAGTSIFL